MKRRQFLKLSGAALLAACNSRGPQAMQHVLSYAQRKNAVLERKLLRADKLDRPKASALNAGEALPVYFVATQIPVWNEAVNGPWRLEVKGLVRTPLSLSLAELMKLPRVTERVNHFCVEGWSAVSEWTGVRVSELARAAGMLPDARAVDFSSFDVGMTENGDEAAFHESWDLESAMHPQTLVCYGLDGAQLGPPHGAPARLFSPIKLGYKCTKYLTEVVFLPAPNGGFWSDVGYEWFAGT